jgi:serine/arginine repetitive matrix protein 2
MYNGVGLTTPRGSGTSGYVQKNLAFINKTTNRMKFQKELEQLKSNPPKPPKRPNNEILQHEQKRLIEIQLLKFSRKLKEEGFETLDIENKVKVAREYLYEKLEQAPLLTDSSSHSKIFKKSEEIKKFEAAFNIDKDYVPGSGFDFEAIEARKRQKIEEVALKQKVEKTSPVIQDQLNDD